MLTTALLALGLSASTPVEAAGGDFLVSLGSGWTWMDPNENLGDTWVATARIGHGLGDVLIFEAEAGYSQGMVRNHWTCPAGATFCEDGETLGNFLYDAATPRLNMLFNLAPGSKVQPFLSIGGGLIYKKVRAPRGILGEPPLEYEDLDNWKNPDIDAMFNAGPGLMIPVLGPLNLRADFRYLLTMGGANEALGSQQDLYSDWEVVGGLTFKFGWFFRDTDGDAIPDRDDTCPNDPEDYDSFEDVDGCPDTDNDRDGVLDEMDDCPHEPEDFDEFQDRDGCPEPDNDNDGLLDFDDECPDQAEDLDGTEDQDGCPEGDNDNDGIADRFDRCPNDPEDFDGWEDEDGCAENDNDSDGIQDFQDECPDVAEVYNGFTDADGCPDDVPAEVQRFTGVIHGIHFEVALDQIKLMSQPLLNQAADVLVRYESIRMEIQGHTDSDGSSEYNLELSAQRAQAVVNYLISRGVDRERLSWVGYGEDRPIFPNDTEEEKEANRRVEFHLIQDGAEETE